MRPIKFRAWDKKEERMISFEELEERNSVHDFLDEYINPFQEMTSEYRGDRIYQQYTGLKDKSGREIYEGDVCKYEDGEHSFIAIVEPDYVNWYLKGISPRDNFNIVGFHDCGKSWLEIIGNIYENRHLLEVQR